MSIAKAKQIRALVGKSPGERRDALHFKTPLHKEASEFKAEVYVGILLGQYTARRSSADAQSPGYHGLVRAAAKLLAKFHDAYTQKDGKFFRALADVLEGKNPDWSARERFIHKNCAATQLYDGPLPTAGQLLRGWKIYCGVVPPHGSEDLKELWHFCFPDKD